MLAVFRSGLLVACITLAGLTVSAPSWAADDDASEPTGAAVQTHDEAMKTAPGKFVQSLGDRAITVIANKSLSSEERNNQFRTILNDSFDLMTIGRFVIGRNWNTATPEQQKEYIQLFSALVVKSYGDRLTLYTGEGFTVTGERAETEKDFIVNSQITHPDGSEPTKIDWRLRQRNGKLGVIDVMVEGVSLSVTQRQEYSAVIQNNGGQIDGLLKAMHQQLDAPSAAPAVDK